MAETYWPPSQFNLSRGQFINVLICVILWLSHFWVCVALFVHLGNFGSLCTLTKFLLIDIRTFASFLRGIHWLRVSSNSSSGCFVVFGSDKSRVAGIGSCLTFIAAGLRIEWAPRLLCIDLYWYYGLY